MKILAFNYEYPPLGGGGGVVHALIAKELARRHRLVVITSMFRGLPSHEVREGVEIYRVPVVGRRDRSVASLVSMLSYPPAAWRRAVRLLRSESFDVVNSHFAVPTGPGSLPPTRWAGLPHVLSLHGGDIYDPSKRLSPHRVPGVRNAVDWVLRKSDVVVAQSTNTRENAYRYYRYDGPIEIIPLGIRQPQVPVSSRDEHGLPNDVFLAITVGRLIKRKAIDRLLKALERTECEGCFLIVVGEGPERSPLEQTARDLGLADRVRFTGRVSETAKWQILQCADVYVSATLHEGFGLVYLEAMAAGLPVVTPDHGGQVDFLKDGETGAVVPHGDIPALARAIADLATHPARAAEIGRSNRDRARGHRIEDCARRYEELFYHVIRDRERAITESPAAR